MAAHHDPLQLGIFVSGLDHQPHFRIAPDVDDLLGLGIGGHVKCALFRKEIHCHDVRKPALADRGEGGLAMTTQKGGLFLERKADLAAAVHRHSFRSRRCLRSRDAGFVQRSGEFRDARSLVVADPQRPQGAYRPRRTGPALQGDPGQYRRRRPVQAGVPKDHAKPPHSGDRRPRRTGRQTVHALRIGGDPDLPVGEDRRQTDPERPNRPLQMPRMDDVPDGWHRPDVRAVEPLRRLRRREDPYAIERYTNEVKRLTRVLNHRLEEVHWLAGDEYSMADIISFPWSAPPRRRARVSRSGAASISPTTRPSNAGTTR